jgi:hypothetical protein
LRPAVDHREVNPSQPETGRPTKTLAAARAVRPAAAPSRQAEAREVPVVDLEVRRVAGPSRQAEVAEAEEAHLAAASRRPDLQVAPFGIPEADQPAEDREVPTRSEAEQRREVQEAGPGIPDVHPAAAR